jgi:hypothetical protein
MDWDVLDDGYRAAPSAPKLRKIIVESRAEFADALQHVFHLSACDVEEHVEIRHGSLISSNSYGAFSQPVQLSAASTQMQPY